MPERATVFQFSQVAVESEAGTNPEANFRRLSSTDIEISPKAEVSVFRPKGRKLATLAALNREWAEASVSGQASYTDLTWLLAALICTPTPTQQGATAAYLSTYDLLTDEPDTVSTLTVEQGGSIRAHSMSYGLMNELGLTFVRGSEGITISGSMIGQAFTDDITMTAEPTEPAQQPILPGEMSIYLADTYAGLAAADPLERVLRAEWKLTNRWGQIWALNADVAGWSAAVEQAPELTATLLMEADAAGMALLEDMRAGASQFLRLQAVGPNIASTYDYGLTIDMCGKISEISDFSDEDGVYAVTWTLQGAHDPTWGQGLQVLLMNTVSAL